MYRISPPIDVLELHTNKKPIFIKKEMASYLVTPTLN